jgi:hypothetical protein
MICATRSGPRVLGLEVCRLVGRRHRLGQKGCGHVEGRGEEKDRHPRRIIGRAKLATATRPVLHALADPVLIADVEHYVN